MACLRFRGSQPGALIWGCQHQRGRLWRAGFPGLLWLFRRVSVRL